MKKRLLFLAIFIVIGVFIGATYNTLKNRSNTTMPEESNYRTINEVNGVSFVINSSIANKATAVSEISEKINIDPNLLYIYKDGGNRYILFGLDSIVVAVEKGTNFTLQKEMTDDDIESDSVSGIWFEKNGNKIQMDYDNNSVTMQVNGGFNISNETYADYVGKLRVLSDGNTQWAIFCGIPGEGKYKDLSDEAKAGIDTIVGSLAFSDYEAPVSDEVYAVTIGDNNLSSNETSVSSPDTIEEAKAETPAKEDKPTSDDTDVEPVEIESETETESEPESETESETEELVSEEETISEEESESESNSETESSYVIDEPIEKPQKGEPLVMENQKKIANKKSSEAYTSDIYSMLSLKDNGVILEFDAKTKQIVTPVINVSRVYKGKTAVDMIKEYCNETGYYEYFDAPVGCEWHVAEYSLLYKDCSSKPYINIKLRGMDGRNIIYKGIPYSKRTYDMFNKAEWNGEFYGTCYCYYAVPIGVTEYSLECGLGTVDYNTNSSAAYYHIKY